MRADPGQLEQVLLNLALNARDAMPRGGALTIETAAVELTEHTQRQADAVRPGGYVVLAVTDTGHGMDRTTLRTSSSRSSRPRESGKGTGLGLSTVYGIVKQSEGYVWAYSEPGQGTTFKMYLPRPHRQDRGRGTSAPVRGTAGREILVVEDEPGCRGHHEACPGGGRLQGGRRGERGGAGAFTPCAGADQPGAYRRGDAGTAVAGSWLSGCRKLIPDVPVRLYLGVH